MLSMLSWILSDRSSWAVKPSVHAMSNTALGPLHETRCFLLHNSRSSKRSVHGCPHNSSTSAVITCCTHNEDSGVCIRAFFLCLSKFTTTNRPDMTYLACRNYSLYLFIYKAAPTWRFMSLRKLKQSPNVRSLHSLKLLSKAGSPDCAAEIKSERKSKG